MRSAHYRVYQFFAALKAGLPAWAGGGRDLGAAGTETLLAGALRTSSQRNLFDRMPPNDRRHALAVAQTLQQAGYEQPAMIQAALLHDVGKSAGQPLIHRVLIVLLEAFWPAALGRLSTPDRPAGCDSSDLDISLIRRIGWWRRPFVVHAQHAALGAAWAAEAECDPLAVTLIARHQDNASPDLTGVDKSLLAALQWADNIN